MKLKVKFVPTDTEYLFCDRLGYYESDVSAKILSKIQDANPKQANKLFDKEAISLQDIANYVTKNKLSDLPKKDLFVFTETDLFDDIGFPVLYEKTMFCDPHKVARKINDSFLERLNSMNDCSSSFLGELYGYLEEEIEYELAFVTWFANQANTANLFDCLHNCQSKFEGIFYQEASFFKERTKAWLLNNISFQVLPEEMNDLNCYDTSYICHKVGIRQQYLSYPFILKEDLASFGKDHEYYVIFKK